jgi:hypothetical protein
MRRYPLHRLRGVLNQAGEGKLMETRLGLALKTTLALAAVLAFASATPAFAQTGAEYPRTMPNYGAPGGGYGGSGIGGGSISAPAPSGSGPTKTTVIPYGPDTPYAVRPHRRAPVHHVRRVPEDKGPFEPAEAHLKLIHNSYAYELPTISSKHIERVHAGKFVNVIGTSRHYAQVTLKNSEIAYVPLSAVELVKPTDKYFKLTADAAVLSNPHQSSVKIAEVHQGHEVHVVGVALDYMKIKMKNGREGYIPVHALE